MQRAPTGSALPVQSCDRIPHSPSSAPGAQDTPARARKPQLGLFMVPAGPRGTLEIGVVHSNEVISEDAWNLLGQLQVRGSAPWLGMANGFYIER